MYHFIGIKGSGMSSLAIILKKMGNVVQGSDFEKHYFTEKGLIENNIKILNFDKENIKEDYIIVKGNMFNEDNIEVKEAIKKNLKIYTYQEIIKELIKKFKTITVSGCHGKTTTSSLIAHIIDANYLIGDGRGEYNKSQYFILEACEYKRHFLNYTSNIAVITNIDLDHIDYYKDIDDVKNAYQEFIKEANIVLINGDDNNSKELIHEKKYYYGLNENNYFKAKNIIYSREGISFDYYVDNNYIFKFNLPFYGKHMLLNSLAAISVCYLEGMNIKNINEKVKKFEGANRRFKETKVKNNIIIDDYAHHPKEIEAVIEATRQKYSDKNIIGIFEPHTYSRTEKFKDEIALKLQKCDYVYIMDIYPAREKKEDYPNINCEEILKKIKNSEKLIGEEIKKLLKYENAVLLFMSPNDLSELENNYIELYKKK